MVALSLQFHLACLTIVAFTQQIREPVWGFCQLLSISIPIMYSWTEEITTGWILGPTGTTMRQTWTKTPASLHFHKPLLCPVGHNDLLGLLESVSCSEPVSSDFWKVSLFPFLQCIITLVKGCRFLQGRLGEKLVVYLFDSIVGSFFKGLGLPLIQRFLCLNWFVWWLTEDSVLCFYVSN